ncbi:hypothetical protein MRQ36_31400 [Micromonospora sp. R77]|uniref:hypothetical protein n=1 Tax=Micromonospora sp. R77 TaxID=2925836 RepID=UPI001F606C16|nr:hypothetical protein [Micromonospora sp. R77]MCI4066825.1 hypothetical protein [Micromonospora sp. R77]
MTSTSAVDSAESLLAAGAVLPADTAGAGDRAVPLTARTYRHPALDDRPVVRLVDAALGEGEDAAVGFLGLAPAAEPAVVGLGPRRPLAFPEWVLVHHPADGRHALALVAELQKLAKQVRSRPKAALDGYQSIADRLARTLPHFLPTFFEQAARVFLAAGQDTYATQLFNKARKAEAQHGLPIDLDRLDEVYVEFASAKVVSATALAGYAKELSAQLPADEALDRFCRLALRAAAAGVVPSTQSATAVNRLARAATKVAGGTDHLAPYLTELLRLPVAADAPAGWWKAHLPALTALADRDPAVRGSLLDLMPTDRDNLVGWLTLLTGTGALAGLSDPDVPETARPQDGSTGWLRRFVSRANSGHRPGRVPQLHPLVERMADRLRAELADSGETLDHHGDLDLLDQLLALQLPVTPPAERGTLDLARWVEAQGERELRALAGDDRFTDALRRGLDQLDGQQHALRRMAATPGIRPLLTDWLRARIRERFAAGLPYLAESVDWLGRLPAEALHLVSDDLRGGGDQMGSGLGEALGVDLVERATRSLRGGLIEELGWPDWELAWQEVTGGDHRVEVTRQESWPYVILGGPTTVRVLGAEGIVLRHDLRIPAGDAWGEPGYHYVDGQLLVCWHSKARGYNLCGYWHRSPDDPQPVHGRSDRSRPRANQLTLSLPGGGRTTGGGVLHVGDTVLPPELPVITDGTSHWVYRHGDDDGEHGWREYDPVHDTHGRRSLPRFLADLPVPGSRLQESASWLRPALSDRAAPAAVPVDGLLGWRVFTLPDGSVRGQDLAGRTVTVAPGQEPVAALVLPGDDRPRAVLKGLVLLDPDGVASAAAGPPSSRSYTRDAIPLPGLRFLGYLQPRDPAGSAALRRMDREVTAALLKVAVDERRAALAEVAARAATDGGRFPAGRAGRNGPLGRRAGVSDRRSPPRDLPRRRGRSRRAGRAGPVDGAGDQPRRRAGRGGRGAAAGRPGADRPGRGDRAGQQVVVRPGGDADGHRGRTHR